jgi:hypothetical protein
LGNLRRPGTRPSFYVEASAVAVARTLDVAPAAQVLAPLARRRGGERGPASGASFYDDPQAFAHYRAPREGVSDPTQAMELPALLEQIGDAAGLRVLDLGCGDAAIGRPLLAAGARA